MKRFIVRQKLLAVGDDFEVSDEAGTPLYYFDGKVFSLGKKIEILTLPSQKPLGVIRRKLFSLRPTYVVKFQDVVAATVFKKIFSFRKSFILRSPGVPDIVIVGRVLEHDYLFYRNGVEIASVSKKWFKGSDTYGVAVSDSADPLLVLSATVVIDLLCHPARDSGFQTETK